MPENVAMWKDSKLGLDDTGNPIVLVLQDDEEIELEDLRGETNLKVEKDKSGKQAKPKSKRRKKDKVYNRRWRILEIIRKNQPTTARVICDKEGLESVQQINWVLNSLRSKGWARVEKDKSFGEHPRTENVYYLGERGKRFLNEHGGFLYPDNPYDPGPNDERREEILKRRLEGVQ